MQQLRRATARFLYCCLLVPLFRLPSASTATTAEFSSYGVSVTADVVGCEFANECWQINVVVAGAPSGHLVLYLHTADSRIAFPCSLGDTSRCECLSNIVSAYSLTSIGDVSAACATAADSPHFTSALYRGDASVVDDVSVQVTENGYTILISDAALESLGAITSGSGADVTAELSVGFAELTPVASLDFYDPVAHEARLTLKKSFLATFSSTSAQASSALSYFAARLHKVTSDSNGEKYYAAATFVLGSSSGRRGSITGIDIPVSSIVVTDGSGAAIAVDCDSESGEFTGNAADFSASCGPFPDDTSVPFCSGQLHTYGEADGLASIFVPLASAPTGGVVTVEFVALANGTGAPAMETLRIGINVDSGVVEWCPPAEAKRALATIMVRVPLSKEEFDEVEGIYAEALASALGVPVGRVKLGRAKRVALRRAQRGLLAEGVELEAAVTLEPEEREGSAALLLGSVAALEEGINAALTALNASASTPLLQVREPPVITELEPGQVRATVDLVEEADLDVRMYSGVMTEEDVGFPAALTLLGAGVGSTLPPPKATLLDGVITVAASYTPPAPNADPADGIADNAVLEVELFRLAAAFLSDPAPDGDLSARIAAPVAAYSPATGELMFDTSQVCVGGRADCEVKTLVERAVLQGAAADTPGAAPEALAVHAATDAAAGAWLQGVAGTGNAFVAAQGQHFRSEMASAWEASGRAHEAYWVSPRREAARAPLQGGAPVSTAVVVWAVFLVRIRAGPSAEEGRRTGRQPRRALLQRSLRAGGEGGRAVASGAVRVEVSVASQLGAAHGVREELVTSWILRLGLSLAEACGPGGRTHDEPGLVQSTRARLLLALVGAASAASSPVLDVQVTSTMPELNGAACSTPATRGAVPARSAVASGGAEAEARGSERSGSHRQHGRSLAATAAEPSVLVEALIVFAEPADGSRPWLDTDQLAASPHGIQAAVLSSAFNSPVKVIHKPTPDADDSGGATAPAGQPESDAGSAGSKIDETLLGVMVLAVTAAIVTVIVGIAVVAHRRRRAAMPAAAYGPHVVASLMRAPAGGKLGELVALPSVPLPSCSVPSSPFSMDRSLSERQPSSPCSFSFGRSQRQTSSACSPDRSERAGDERPNSSPVPGSSGPLDPDGLAEQDDAPPSPSRDASVRVV